MRGVFKKALDGRGKHVRPHSIVLQLRTAFCRYAGIPHPWWSPRNTAEDRPMSSRVVRIFRSNRHSAKAIAVMPDTTIRCLWSSEQRSGVHARSFPRCEQPGPLPMLLFRYPDSGTSRPVRAAHW